MDNSVSWDGNSNTTTILPSLLVRDGTEAVTFYEAAFGAIELWRIEDDADKIVAGLSIDDAEFHLADEDVENANFSPESLGGTCVRITLIVENPDSLFHRAVSAGATEVWPVADQPWGWRQGRLVDPFGHHWLIGKPIQHNEIIDA